MTEHQCFQEARITALETKLQNKKEHLEGVDNGYYHLRDKLESISINVAELTTLIKENMKKEDENDKKIDELQVEIAQLHSTIDTFKWLLPVACSILTVILNYLI